MRQPGARWRRWSRLGRLVAGGKVGGARRERAWASASVAKRGHALGAVCLPRVLAACVCAHGHALRVFARGHARTDDELGDDERYLLEKDRGEALEERGHAFIRNLLPEDLRAGLAGSHLGKHVRRQATDREGMCVCVRARAYVCVCVRACVCVCVCGGGGGMCSITERIRTASKGQTAVAQRAVAPTEEMARSGVEKKSALPGPASWVEIREKTSRHPKEREPATR